MNEQSYLGKFFEGLFVILIILVIGQTFSEEFATFMDYSGRIRKNLLLAGFGFDLIFTIEFIIRLSISKKRGNAGAYFMNESGFIDLVSSIPLLLFNSGPLVYITFFSGEAGLLTSLGVLSFLKIIRVIRIARTLRFLRTLKIFGKLRKKYTMTPIFISRVLTIAISVIVASIIGFFFIDNGNVIQSKSVEVQNILNNYMRGETAHNFDKIIGGSESVLYIMIGERIVYRGIDDTAFQENYFNDDYYKRNLGGYEVFFNNKDSKRIHAFINMLMFATIIGIIIFVVILYRRFFNRHIARTALVMLKGFKTIEYSTPVRIAEKNDEFEIYQLANQYNRKWLPIKSRIVELKKKNI